MYSKTTFAFFPFFYVLDLDKNKIVLYSSYIIHKGEFTYSTNYLYIFYIYFTYIYYMFYIIQIY